MCPVSIYRLLIPSLLGITSMIGGSLRVGLFVVRTY